jgi:hypothetical protein
MATTPIIRSLQDGVTVTGVGREDLATGLLVTLTDAEASNTGAAYQWTLEDKPPGSSVTITNPTTATASFTPDVTGSYRIRCSVNGIVLFSAVILAVPLPNTGGRIPSYLETNVFPTAYTGGGNTAGWHTAMVAMFRAIDAATASFPGYGVVGNIAPVAAAASAGVLTTLARADHAHAHGNQAGGSLHADVIAGGASGFMSGAQATALATAVTNIATLDTRTSGFTNTTIPVANVSGLLVSSPITLVSNLITHAASSSGGAVGLLVQNTAAAAASTYAYVEVKAASGSFASNDPRYLLTSGSQQYHAAIDASNSAVFTIQPGGVPVSGGLGLYVNVDGIVGVGTTAPTTVLGEFFQINGGSAALHGASKNTTTTGSSGWNAESASGTTVRLLSEGTAAASTLYGLTRANLGYVDSSNRLALVTIGAHSLYLMTNSLERLQVDSAGNVSMGTAALATNATDGFFYDETCAGTPTGVPTAKAGRAPRVYDTSNDISYVYNGSWKAIGGGANSLATYIVQAAANAPVNAQVLGSLATGMLKVTTSTGVVSSFVPTANTIPLGSAGVLVDSTLTLASNLLTHAASSSGAAIALLISNTSNTASSSALLELKTAGASSGSPALRLNGVGAVSWDLLCDVPSGGFLKIRTTGGSDTVSIGTLDASYQGAGRGTFTVLQNSTAQFSRLSTSGLAAGAIFEITSYGNASAASNVFGAAPADKTFLTSTKRILLGTTAALQLDFATNDIIRQTIDISGNVLIGIAGGPTSLATGIVLGNGTAPSAAPSGSAAHWAASGVHHFMGTDGVDIVL